MFLRDEIGMSLIGELGGCDLHAPRGGFMHMVHHEVGDSGRVLIGDQTARNLGMGSTGQNRFQTLSLETTV